MNAIELVILLGREADSLEDLVNDNMKHDGDTEAESQRIVMIHAINGLRRAINGIRNSDMKGG